MDHNRQRMRAVAGRQSEITELEWVRAIWDPDVGRRCREIEDVFSHVRSSEKHKPELTRPGQSDTGQ
jgi:hypothetical protein